MDFSIIVPAFNAEEYIEACLNSIFRNAHRDIQLEVLVIDDCSTDSTFELLTNFQKSNGNLIVLRTQENSGPGGARNVGVQNASGDWILFLDSDDCYDGNALVKLKRFIDANAETELDAIGYNWMYNRNSIHRPKTHFIGRMDGHYLELEKDQLITHYLQLQMDNSVIYTAIRRDLIVGNSISFREGYHEDVDYIFLVYWYARKIKYFDQVLYYKTSRAESIVNTISVPHIKGFMRSYKEIGAFISTEGKNEAFDYINNYYVGLIAVIATRAREIYRHSSDAEERAILYEELHESWLEFDYKPKDNLFPYDRTLYSHICSRFLEIMDDQKISHTSKEALITQYIDEVKNKRWSCVDLHGSAFLAPNQIRTCCKRFFVDGEMKGDVVLLNSSGIDSTGIMIDKVLDAKKKLYASINKGEKTECDGCPFLEFKEWGSFDDFKINKLSFEYHSVCNLKCTYCSDTYYGGTTEMYDVNAFVENLIDEGMLAENSLIIWGGGEPVLDKNFPSHIQLIVDRLPRTIHRVITNSVTFSEKICKLLSEGKVSIFTSIDAGTEETFKKVRGMNRLYKVMDNVKKYASINPKGVTIKYIFTDGNEAIEEVVAFVGLIRKYKLFHCNFQISSDFKEEFVASKDLVLMVSMYKMLLDIGCKVVFFDDLLMHKLGDFSSHAEESFRLELKKLGIEGVLADKDSYESVAVWGAGEQAKLLVHKSMFFKHVDIKFFVDSTPSKINTRYLDREIFSPQILLKSEIPIIIAAVQSYSLIYQEFLKLGINEERLIHKLIL